LEKADIKKILENHTGKKLNISLNVDEIFENLEELFENIDINKLQIKKISFDITDDKGKIDYLKIEVINEFDLKKFIKNLGVFEIALIFGIVSFIVGIIMKFVNA